MLYVVNPSVRRITSTTLARDAQRALLSLGALATLFVKLAKLSYDPRADIRIDASDSSAVNDTYSCKLCPSVRCAGGPIQELRTSDRKSHRIP